MTIKLCYTAGGITCQQKISSSYIWSLGDISAEYYAVMIDVSYGLARLMSIIDSTVHIVTPTDDNTPYHQSQQSTLE